MYKVTVTLKSDIEHLVDSNMKIRKLKTMTFICNKEPIQQYSFVKIKVGDETTWIHKDSIVSMVVSYHCTQW